jgi:hypothetical protein
MAMEICLARAVVQLFYEEKPAHLPVFSPREWERTSHWLDASGMALYLLAQLRSLGLAGQLPDVVLWRLEKCCTDNRDRTLDLFSEFARINAGFSELGLRYANLKGFTLFPHAVADPALRYQSDLDLLVPHDDAPRAAEFLKRSGYLLIHAGSSIWEFKANVGVLPAHEDMYKVRPQRSIELHLLASGGTEARLLDRIQVQQWNGLSFPALSEADKFIFLAQHLFRHMRSEWTRLSWVLEFKRFLDAHRDDAQLWRSVRAVASSTPQIATAIGASMLMTTVIFGDCIPPGMHEWTIDLLPLPVCTWVERYSEAVLLADFPGTKLYLLLETALAEGAPDAKTLRRKRLFPRRLPPPLVHASAANDTLRLRIGRACLQLRFTLSRLRFHLVQGTRYLLEAQRWKPMTLPQPHGIQESSRADL